MTIDLFTSEDRYLPWITTAPVFTLPSTLGIAHARVTLARHRSPNLRTGCRIIATHNCNRFNGHERLFFLSIGSQQSAISSCWGAVRHRRHRHPGGQVKILSWYILMSRYKISGHRLEISGRWLEISGRRLEISGRQKQSSPGGSDGRCWAVFDPATRHGCTAHSEMRYLRV